MLVHHCALLSLLSADACVGCNVCRRCVLLPCFPTQQGLCRRLRNLPTVAKLYLLVAWQTVRRESPVPPKSLVQKAKAMNKLKNLFIGFGGLLWVWKMGAMEALEIWTQSMNVRSLFGS